MHNPAAATEFDSHPPSLTYEPYFGLREKPFSLSADPRFLYTGPSRQGAFEALLAGIKRREGLIVLSGEIGTGKTTLCRAVLSALDRKTFSTFVRDPFLSREDLLKTLLIDFGVMSIEDLKNGRLNGASRQDLSYTLYEFLDSLVPLQAFAVLIIDEAQNLSHSLLEEIRILSELERREKLLQVVLVGQPELKAALKLPQLRQVDQRVSVRCELQPLSVDEVGDYIVHRLRVARCGTPGVFFDFNAWTLIARESGGVPRVINLICDRALHLAHEAGVQIVTRALVEQALGVLGRDPVEAEPAAAIPTHVELLSDVQLADEPVAQEGTGPRAMPASAAAPEFADEPVEPAASNPLHEFSSESDFEARPSSAWRTRVAAVAVALLIAVGIAVWYATATLTAELSTIAPRLVPGPPSAAIATTYVRVEDQPSADAAVVTASPEVLNDQPGYAIQIASFQSRTRADRLVDELQAQGYGARVSDVDLGSRGQWLVVLVGRYPAADEAQQDLTAIQERGLYFDAQVVTISRE